MLSPSPFNTPACARPGALVVAKVGGSVFTTPAAYRTAARALAARLQEDPAVQLVVVVSAEQGATDALLRTACNFDSEPDPEVVDLLWSTGELRAAALLTLALQSAGVRAAAANIHQAGLVNTAGRTVVRPLRLRALLSSHDIVVAPGFLARAEGDAIVSLGRGGSDLTAVLLAAGLGADRCELIKDVPGYFTDDPRHTPLARHLPALDYEAALALADQGCPLVQRQAIVAARDAGLPLVVGAFTDARFTAISSSVS